LALISFLAASASPALADRQFTTRFSTNDTGNIAFAANTLMVCPASAAGCTAARNTPPIAAGSNNALDNNNYPMQYVNTASGTVNGAASFDSSSATLSLPATATVLFAGLYWGGDTSAGSSPNGVAAPGCATNAATCLCNQAGLKVPGASGYTLLTASPSTVDSSSTAPSRYSAFVDVTGMVAAAGSGTYSVANVQAGTGGDRYAGWTLVVAYQDPTQPPRNLTVDDGFVTINWSAPPTAIPIGGFRTPPSGPVQTTLGFVGYEGDSGLTGDTASLNNVTLSDAANPSNNFWCSAISNLGTNVTTRNPNDINNFAYDSKLVSGNGILPNNATSATVKVTTSGDAHYPAVVTVATNLYAPQIASTKTVTNLTHPGGPDQPGDTLQYTVSYTNTGSDSAANYVLRDSIPDGTTYLPGTLHIGGSQGPSNPTDALGDDAGEFNPTTNEVVFRLGIGGNGTTGGAIRPNDTDTATFDVTINRSDTPGQQIVNQATAMFTGFTLATPFTNTSNQVTNTVSAPSLTLAKSHIGGLIAGQPTTFALAVSNVGNLGTTGTVTVTDPFAASSFSSIANANGNGWSCSISALTLTCTRSDPLAAGTSYPPIFVDGTVADSAPATVSNTATVSGGGSAPASGSDGARRPRGLRKACENLVAELARRPRPQRALQTSTLRAKAGRTGASAAAPASARYADRDRWRCRNPDARARRSAAHAVGASGRDVRRRRWRSSAVGRRGHPRLSGRGKQVATGGPLGRDHGSDRRLRGGQLGLRDRLVQTVTCSLGTVAAPPPRRIRVGRGARHARNVLRTCR